ncbi:MAG TPA: hypothetical protein VGM06_11400 [Polyangiaceae bacterium]|jgi:hypothetical protein
MIRFALALSVFGLLGAPGAAAPLDTRFASGGDDAHGSLGPHAAGCGDCRVTFMKCLVAGKDLPADARRKHNEQCSAAAGSCYKGCTD